MYAPLETSSFFFFFLLFDDILRHITSPLNDGNNTMAPGDHRAYDARS